MISWKILQLSLIVLLAWYMAYKQRPVPERTRHLVIEKNEEGCTPEEISWMYDIKPSTVKEYVRRWNRDGTIQTNYEQRKAASPDGKVRRQKILDMPLYRDHILTECDLYPTQPLDSYVDDFQESFGFYVSRDTIDRMLQENNRNWKKISRVALEGDDIEEHEFWECMEEIVSDPHQLVFLDESYRSDKTANPTHGRGKGRVYVKVSFTRGGYKFTLIIATWCGGVLCYEIYFGAADAAIFHQFLYDHLIHILNAYPGDFSVLVLDNCGIHKGHILKEFCNDVGCILAWLPRYKPLLNLAEYGFRDVKAIERSKNVYGPLNGMLSLIDSVEKIRYKDYSSILRSIGYI